MIPLAGSAYTYAYATWAKCSRDHRLDLTLDMPWGEHGVLGWSNHFIELPEHFSSQMPLWLAYDHWTALGTAEKIVAREMQERRTKPGSGFTGFLDKVTAIMAMHSAGIAARAHDLVNAPKILEWRSGLTCRHLSLRW